MHRAISLTDIQEAEKTNVEPTNTAALEAWNAGKPLKYMKAVLFGDFSAERFLDIAHEFFFEMKAHGEPESVLDLGLVPFMEVAEEFFFELAQGSVEFEVKKGSEEKEAEEQRWETLWKTFANLHMGDPHED